MTYKTVNKILLKPIYARGKAGTLHRVQNGVATCCGLKIYPSWEVIELSSNLNLSECSKCKSGHNSFADYEANQRRLVRAEGFDVDSFINFSDISDKQKRDVFPALFNHEYHEREREKLKLLFEERRRYFDWVNARKARRKELIPQLDVSDEGYIYLFHALGTPFYKTGYSINPLQRLCQVKSQSPNTAVENCSCISSKKYEA